MALALDESNDGDKVFAEGDFKFCINADLLAQVQSVRLDLTYMGFQIEPGVALGGGGSSCGGCGSSSSCCTSN